MFIFLSVLSHSVFQVIYNLWWYFHQSTCVFWYMNCEGVAFVRLPVEWLGGGWVGPFQLVTLDTSFPKEVTVLYSTDKFLLEHFESCTPPFVSNTASNWHAEERTGRLSSWTLQHDLNCQFFSSEEVPENNKPPTDLYQEQVHNNNNNNNKVSQK